MKTIGIITIHKSTSYGACLQAHALWKYLQSKGFDCEIIDLYRNIHKGYIPSKRYTIYESPYRNGGKKSTSLFKRLKTSISIFLLNKIYKEADKIREQKFNKFNSLIKYSQPYYCIDALYQNPPLYDIYITGSDQVWNPTIGIPLEPYFLTFTDSNHKISYASSFGVAGLKESYKKMFKPWLSNYKAISCREKEGASIICEILDKKVPICLDPTLLIGTDYWKSILVLPTFSKPYLLIFFLKGLSKKVLNFCTKVASENNLEIIILGKASLQQTIKYHCVADAGPEEFIGWIKKAKIVITDSFHGLVFSMMLSNCFYIKLDNAGLGKSRNSRIETVLSNFNLQDRILNISSTQNILTSINRQEIERILHEKQIESSKYLSNNL